MKQSEYITGLERIVIRDFNNHLPFGWVESLDSTGITIGYFENQYTKQEVVEGLLRYYAHFFGMQFSEMDIIETKCEHTHSTSKPLKALRIKFKD